MAGDRSKIKTNHAWMGLKRGGDTRVYTALFQGLNNGAQQELENYYRRIITHDTFWPLFQETSQIVENSRFFSRLSDERYMTNMHEKFKEMLRKFLEVESTLND